ncbi:MAG: hypothetical protein LBK44_01690 [Spirochaetales bacterium]|jgi:hypothetical protein|nr:hypothetical protein [Spirochaetales bacterium]
MAEYGFTELVKEIANNKKSFAEYTFNKKQIPHENTREVYLAACEDIANIYIPYGFKYSKSGQHLTLKQKDSEFIYKISFGSSHYNVPGKNISIDVCANVLSHKYKKWKSENRTELNLKNEIELSECICGGNIGNLRKEHKYLQWNIASLETREKEIENIIDAINKLAIPFFEHFNDVHKLKDELEHNGINYYFSHIIEEMVDFYIYLTKKEITERDRIKKEWGYIK